MRSLLAKFQRELTVFAAALIATGGFAIAALVSEGSQAVGAGTYVVRSDTTGGLVTGEVVEVTTNQRGKTVTVVRWHTRQGGVVTRSLLAQRPDAVIRTVAEPGTTVTQPALMQRVTPTIYRLETITDTQTVVSTQIVTETLVVTETVPPPPATLTVQPDEPELP
jgi:hypothetical protein